MPPGLTGRQAFEEAARQATARAMAASGALAAAQGGGAVLSLLQPGFCWMPFPDQFLVDVRSPGAAKNTQNVLNMYEKAPQQ